MRAFERVWLPLLVSALTMVIGFGSLMVNRITAIWELGLFAVVGVVWLTLTSLTFIPAALQLLPLAPRRPRSGKTGAALGAGSERARRTGLPAAAWRVVQCAPLRRRWRSWRRGTSRWTRISSGYFDPALAGAASTTRPSIARSSAAIRSTLVVEGAEPGMLKRWEVLKQIKELQALSC